MYEAVQIGAIPTEETKRTLHPRADNQRDVRTSMGENPDAQDEEVL